MELQVREELSAAQQAYTEEVLVALFELLDEDQSGTYGWSELMPIIRTFYQQMWKLSNLLRQILRPSVETSLARVFSFCVCVFFL